MQYLVTVVSGCGIALVQQLGVPGASLSCSSRPLATRTWRGLVRFLSCPLIPPTFRRLKLGNRCRRERGGGEKSPETNTQYHNPTEGPDPIPQPPTHLHMSLCLEMVIFPTSWRPESVWFWSSTCAWPAFQPSWMEAWPSLSTRHVTTSVSPFRQRGAESKQSHGRKVNKMGPSCPFEYYSYRLATGPCGDRQALFRGLTAMSSCVTCV